MELAAVHKHSARQTHEVGSPHSSTPQLVRPPAEQRLQRPDSDQSNDDRSDHRTDHDGGEYRRLFAERRHSHPGEIRILRELLEQQKREEELRRYWHEMGFQLKDDSSYDASDNDDHFKHRCNYDVDIQRIAPHEERYRKHQKLEGRPAPLDFRSVKHSVNSLASHNKEALAKPNHSHGTCHEDVTEIDKSISCGVKLHVSPSSAAPAHARSSEMESQVTEHTPNRAETLPRPSKNDVDDDDDCNRTTPLFEPQAERSMEREVRAAREREEALRNARGLTTALNNEARRSVQIEVVKPRQAVTDVVVTGSAAKRRQPDYQSLMKRYTEHLLKAELHRDRQRELDLLNGGIVQSISEEREGDQLKFVDVPPTENRSAPRNVPSVATHHTVRERRPELSGFSEHTDVTVDKAAASRMSSGADKPLPIPGNVPLVLRTYPYPYFSWQNSVTDDTHVMSTRLSPEERIEKEIAEFRKRENELRFVKKAYYTNTFIKLAAIKYRTSICNKTSVMDIKVQIALALYYTVISQLRHSPCQQLHDIYANSKNHLAWYSCYLRQTVA